MGTPHRVSLAYPVAPRGRLFVFLDAVLVLWVAGWIVYGFAVHREVQDLASVSDTLVRTGQAVDSSAAALKPLRSLPFGIGNRIAGLAEQVHAVALSAERSGADSRHSIDVLAVELGFAIALIPTVPLVAIYAPLRVARVQDVRAVRRQLRERPDDPTFQEFLARRAAEKLPYHVLREVTATPWRDIESGRHATLARAELRRLGFRPPGHLRAIEENDRPDRVGSGGA
jgi:hypothetical protein